MPVLKKIQQHMANKVSVFPIPVYYCTQRKERSKLNSKFQPLGLGSLLGIVFIILLVFRRIVPLFQVLLPVMVGCLVAVAVTCLCV